jgi:hypothetical protein
MQANGMFINRFKKLVSIASCTTKQRRLNRMPQSAYPRDVRSSIKEAHLLHRYKTGSGTFNLDGSG